MERRSIRGYLCVVALLINTLTVISESHGQECRDMKWPGGQNPCPKLIKSGFYDTEEGFCESAYYAKHCCQTCRLEEKRQLERRQREDNFLLRLLRK